MHAPSYYREGPSSTLKNVAARKTDAHRYTHTEQGDTQVLVASVKIQFVEKLVIMTLFPYK